MQILALILCIIISCPLNLDGQENRLNGRVAKTNTPVRDTICFRKDRLIPAKYYEVPAYNSYIDDNVFSLNNEITYPHIYYSILANDKGKILNRPKIFFFDTNSSKIVIDFANWGKSFIDGSTGSEFESTFASFIKDKKKDIPQDYLYAAPGTNDPSFDTLLFNYTLAHPKSYIPIWLIIKRHYSFGYSQIRYENLNIFDKKIQSSKLWKMIKSDMENATIKPGNIFPSLNYLSMSDQTVPLSIPKHKKYILLDFWFSTCKPCLTSIPKLKELYGNYKDNGFDIIGISVDRDFAKNNWIRAIHTNKLVWPQYLDLNALESDKLLISTFPRYVLINGDGKILNNRISLEELELFLSKNLQSVKVGHHIKSKELINSIF